MMLCRHSFPPTQYLSPIPTPSAPPQTTTDKVDFFFDTRDEATLACGEAEGLLAHANVTVPTAAAMEGA